MVLSKLKKAGMVETKEGLHGGYQFQKSAHTVTLGGIAKALSMKFVDANCHSKELDKTCLVASGMAQVMGDLDGQLNDLCLQHLETITLADIDRMLPPSPKG